MRVIHGRINLDPLYTGLSQFFQNIVDSQLTYLPNSVNMIPFNQEICILLWRFMTINQVLISPDHLARLRRLHDARRLPLEGSAGCSDPSGLEQEESDQV
jgi:hypothetical protein